MELIAAGLMIIVALQHVIYSRERTQLLDRLMARDLSEYKVMTSRPRATKPIEQAGDMAREIAWAEKNGLVEV